MYDLVSKFIAPSTRRQEKTGWVGVWGYGTCVGWIDGLAQPPLAGCADHDG